MFSHIYTDVPIYHTAGTSQKGLLALSYDSAERNIVNCMTVEVLKINDVHFFWSKLLLDIM